jgi:hypothetical protein
MRVHNAVADCLEAIDPDAALMPRQRPGRRWESVVTRGSCPDCCLRFTPAATAYLPACPVCGGSLVVLDRPEAAVGLRLFIPDEVPVPSPTAIAARMPIPGQADPVAGRDDTTEH